LQKDRVVAGVSHQKINLKFIMTNSSVQRFFLNFLLIVSLINGPFAAAQETPAESITQPIIHLEASAMREIVPDEYYFQVLVKESMKNKVKTTIEMLEARMIQGLDSIGISKDQISLERMSDLQTYKRRRSKTHLTSQVYQIKLTSLEKLKPMFEVLSKVPAVSASLSHVDHSKMPQFRQEVKIEAMKAGKEKATYLLEAVGSKVGSLLHVRELNLAGPRVPSNQMAYANTAINFRQEYKWDKAQQESLTYKTIRIRFAFELKFEIVD